MEQWNRVELHVQLELRDFLRTNYWLLFRRFRFLLLISVLIGIVLPAFFVVEALWKGKPSPGGNMWLLLFPALLLAMLVSTYVGAKRHFASNKSLHGTLHFSVSEDGLDVSAPLCSGHSDWGSFYQAYETKYDFILLIGTNLFYTIPKRCFQTGEQLQHFKSLLISNLASKAKLR